MDTHFVLIIGILAGLPLLPLLRHYIGLLALSLWSEILEEMQKDWRGYLLEVILLLLLLDKEVQSCGITLESAVIHLGAPLLASCSSQCAPFGSGALVWKLDGDFVPKNRYRNVQKNTSSVYFDSFNQTSGLLQCFVISSEGLQIVDQIRITAGYPPSPPTNVSCLMNISNSVLNCTWHPGRDSLLKTNVTLLSSKSVAQCKLPMRSNFKCTAKSGQSICYISRGHYQSTKQLAVWVTEENELGSASSTPICFIPLQEVKLNPISIIDAQVSADCVKLKWNLKKEGFAPLRCETRYKSDFQKEWNQAVESPIGSNETTQCGLLLGTTYDFQIRCIRKNFNGQWSDWGPLRSVTTADSAPTGKLQTWWKIIKGTPESPEEIQLFWKKFKREEANSKFLWYIVKTSSDLNQGEAPLCYTSALNCTFSLLPGMKSAFVWAHNRVGASPVQHVNFSIGAPVQGFHVYPINSFSLHVEWELKTSAKAYVLEWCKTLQLPSCEINWQIVHEGCNTYIVKDNIEPLQMYTITLYPVYENSLGLPVQTEVYSREAAPDFSPAISFSSVSKTHAEVYWEPIPLENQNGFITKYTIFWIDAERRTYSSTVNGSVRKYEIKDLVPSTTYHVFLRSSTAAGSVNGSIVKLHTTMLDKTDITLIIVFFILVCFLAAISAFIAYIMRHERMKNHLWPQVPDPAKSRMGKWNFFLEEVPRMILYPTDVSQTVTNEINIVEGLQGKKAPIESPAILSTQNYMNAPKKQTAGAKDSANKWRSYVNTDTVQYAQIITGGYRQQSPPSSTYARSDSTQPLLCDLSPGGQNYENMWFHYNQQEDSHQEDNVFMVEEVEPVASFPLLQALQIHRNGERFELF